jgi:hypothetical protein
VGTTLGADGGARRPRVRRNTVSTRVTDSSGRRDTIHTTSEVQPRGRHTPEQTVRARAVVSWWREPVGGSRRQTDHERRRPAFRYGRLPNALVNSRSVGRYVE